MTQSIFFLHGFELSGSGSNLYTREIARSFKESGFEVHIFCHEPFPDRFDFVDEWRLLDESGRVRERKTFEGNAAPGGRCILVEADLSGLFAKKTLPVYNVSVHEGFEEVAAFPALSDRKLENYIEIHYQALSAVFSELSRPPAAVLANHVTPIAEAARRFRRTHTVPFVLVPHGSAIEYGARVDDRLLRLACESVSDADLIIAGSPELRERLNGLFPPAQLPHDLESKVKVIPFGTRTELFTPRTENTKRLLSERINEGPSGGLSAGKRKEFLKKLASGDAAADFEKMCHEFRYGFRVDAPDEDCLGKLEEIDWEREPAIVFSGKLVAGKGVQLLLAAFPELLNRNPHSRLIVAGEGSFRPVLEALMWGLEAGVAWVIEKVISEGWALEGKARRPLEYLGAYIEKCGGTDAFLGRTKGTPFSEKVVFTGWLSHEQLAPLLSLARSTVLPSIVPEASPMVIGESLACATPIVVSDAGGSRALLDLFLRPTNLETDRFTAPTDPACDFPTRLAEALAYALTLDGETRSPLRKAVEPYSWREIPNRILSAIESVKRRR